MALRTAPHRPRRLPRAFAFVASVSALGCAGFGLVAPAASASLLPSCAPVQTATPFSSFGDGSSYFLMPGGAFETGTAGWTVAGSSVAAGNEPWLVAAKTDTHSLAMTTGALVVSPTECVAMGENTIRLFVRNPGVASSYLHIQAYVQNPLTGLVLSTGFDIAGSASATGWAPTGRLLIPNLLGGLLGTQRLTLVFSVRGAPAVWNIDDVYVDPFKLR